MTDDERTLLAAIVADPADDTARLAYADCIQETGDPTQVARAEFIRVQIEAERHHPDSAARAQLDAQAQTLLAEHWIDWWRPVCEAVGLPLPQPKPIGRLGRWAGHLGLRTRAGWPYYTSGNVICAAWAGTDDRSEFGAASFERGFPDVLQSRFLRADGTHFLTRWPLAAPLAKIRTGLSHGRRLSWECWPDGPHLSGVRYLGIGDWPLDVVFQILDSPHLKRLEEVNYPIPWGAERQENASLLARLVASRWAGQFKRLHVALTTVREAEIVASAATLAGLRNLWVSFDPVDGDPTVRLNTLARSRYLSGIQELAVSYFSVQISGLNSRLIREGYRAITTGAVWTGLRKLVVDTILDAEGLRVLLSDARLPELEELQITVSSDRGVLDFLARSSLLKQLRHLTLDARDWCVAGLSVADLLHQLPRAVDLDRIETITIYMPYDEEAPGLDKLLRPLGDRLRFR